MSTDGQARIDRQVLNILNSKYPIYTNIKKDSIYELSNHPLLESEILTRFPINSYNWKLVDSTKTINGYKCKLAKGSFSQENVFTENSNKIDFFAWYSPELPSQYGPALFTGLPGLILIAGYDMFIFEIKELKQKKIDFEFPKNESITEDELILKMKSIMNSKN
jgi:GLPGLI family protein